MQKFDGEISSKFFKISLLYVGSFGESKRPLELYDKEYYVHVVRIKGEVLVIELSDTII